MDKDSFSRSGLTSVDGKCSVPVKTSLTEFDSSALDDICHKLGRPRAEVIRDILRSFIIERSGEQSLSFKVSVARNSGEDLSELALLEGMTVEQYLSDIVNKHLYGHQWREQIMAKKRAG